MLNEFKEFALRGKVIDLAVGVIIGGAFGKIVSSLVSDVIMPPVGLLLGRINFIDLYFNLSGTQYASLKLAQEAGAPTINYGLFLNTLVDFLIVAGVLFLALRPINALQRTNAAPTAEKRECPYCCTQIPFKAVRCPHCTSELGEAASARIE